MKWGALLWTKRLPFRSALRTLFFSLSKSLVGTATYLLKIGSLLPPVKLRCVVKAVSGSPGHISTAATAKPLSMNGVESACFLEKEAYPLREDRRLCKSLSLCDLDEREMMSDQIEIEGVDISFSSSDLVTIARRLLFSPILLSTCFSSRRSPYWYGPATSVFGYVNPSTSHSFLFSSLENCCPSWSIMIEIAEENSPSPCQLPDTSF